MTNKTGTDGPTGLPAAQELLPCPKCGVDHAVQWRADFHDPEDTVRCLMCNCQAPLSTWQMQAAAPGGVAPTPSPDLAELREALERDDDDRTTADWNLIDRWARAALVIIPSHDVWRTALLRIADEHKVYKGHGDYDIVPACSAEDAQSLARTALRNGEPG